MLRAALLSAAACVVLLAAPGLAQADFSWSSGAQIDPHAAEGLGPVSCVSSSLCVAIAGLGQEVTIDPAAPASETAASVDPGAGLFGLSCVPGTTPATQCTALVESTDQEYEHEVTFDPQSPGSVTSALVGGAAFLTALSCASETQCTAVDVHGGEVTFDPQSPGPPAPVSIASGHDLVTVSCTTTTSCTATGLDGEEVTFDPQSPGTPTVVTIDSTAAPRYGGPDFGLRQLSCVPVSDSSTQCTALDGNGQEVTFDPSSPGTSTPQVIDSVMSFQALSCASPTECVAFDGQGFELSFDPQAPGTPVPDKLPRLYALSCLPAMQCVAVGPNGQEAAFDPRSPGDLTDTTTLYTGAALNALACPALTQCTAVDDVGRELTFDPNSPGTPTPVPLNASGWLHDVACPSITQCTTVDGSGEEVTFDPQAPGTPAPVAIDTGNGLYSLACPATNLCITVGPGGQEVTFDPQSPGTSTPATIDSGLPLFGVACPLTTQCTAIDFEGQQLTFDPQASGPLDPSPVPVDDTGAEMDSVACSSAQQCTATDYSGNVIAFDPQSPADNRLVAADAGNQLGSIACPSTNDCVTVNGANAVEGNPGSAAAWTVHPITGVTDLTSMACPSLGECVAGDSGGVGAITVGTVGQPQVPPPASGGSEGTTGGGASGSGGTTAAPGGNRPTGGPALGAVSAGHARVKRDVARAPVLCEGAPTATCTVTLTLSLTEKVKLSHIAGRAKQHKTTTKIVVLATNTARLTGGQRKTVTISLDRAGVQMLKAHHRLAVKLALTSAHTNVSESILIFTQR